ncbi:hypothetical protein [Enterococcus sp. HMSC076E04]|uniref:hypothetical protein n=1 Tax=Enterococcus sp. HMSC076E04 TaxID=1739465 RepID=UPI0008A57267|nr:hypothetical protein [Enterococcus sp. HMSC076E04]HBL1652533.1 hypothetical protein [Enterococcus faecium]OFQ02080.1 hypothetical protein HMPREF2961_00415 [Enterococcus sp. HMSC076E04]HBL2025582.1 hypothetical protein [Enterococcus faecium]HBL2296191.1 hypothetical protein [Enterococcus faecium]HBL3602855.1 hypothetical protein [Enterococcus faecium]
MQEQSVMEIIKWFIGLIMIMTMVSIGLFCVRLQDINTFKQQVNYQIERKGGLTTEAVEAIDKYSDTNYDGRFTIESDKLNQKVSYGEEIDYTIKATIPIQILPLPDVSLSFKGNSVSQIR